MSSKKRKMEDDDDVRGTSKSGRVRKKSAKVLEMEEAEELEKKIFPKGGKAAEDKSNKAAPTTATKLLHCGPSKKVKKAPKLADNLLHSSMEEYSDMDDLSSVPSLNISTDPLGESGFDMESSYLEDDPITLPPPPPSSSLKVKFQLGPTGDASIQAAADDVPPKSKKSKKSEHSTPKQQPDKAKPKKVKEKSAKNKNPSKTKVAPPEFVPLETVSLEAPTDFLANPDDSEGDLQLSMNSSGAMDSHLDHMSPVLSSPVEKTKKKRSKKDKTEPAIEEAPIEEVEIPHYESPEPPFASMEDSEDEELEDEEEEEEEEEDGDGEADKDIASDDDPDLSAGDVDSDAVSSEEANKKSVEDGPVYGNADTMNKLAMKVKTSAERANIKRQKKDKDPSKKKRKRRKGPTAYTMFCNSYRSKVLAENPGITNDFSSISKRLGEIWQSLPRKEKIQFRAKAKRRVTKMRKTDISIVTGPRKAMTGKVKPVHSTHMKAREMAKAMSNRVSVSEAPSVGCTAVDIAAHLKLLGDSLRNIGSRLMEHNGQIAVQGGLSVLLDSMVCALGPLMCLTDQVPELHGMPHTQHQQTLDHIAYIMPGIG